MTVGIASRSYDILFLVADKMLTAGDIEFEPAKASKIRAVTSSIYVTYAGDSAFFAEIYADLRSCVLGKIALEPHKWLAVKDVVDFYSACRNSLKLKRAEASLLAPLGLDRDSFLVKQKLLNEELASQLSRELINFQVPGLDVIFAGIDENGPHIYSIEDEYVQCHDMIGFASIGSGSRHAESQFMLARYSGTSLVSEALFLTYIAKKRAEIAPGVGTETDVYMIGSELGRAFPLQGEAITKLDEAYRLVVDAEASGHGAGQALVKDYIDELGKGPAAKEQKSDEVP